MILLQILDEGTITDSQGISTLSDHLTYVNAVFRLGRKVDFRVCLNFLSLSELLLMIINNRIRSFV